MGHPIGKEREEREYSIPKIDTENIPSSFPGCKAEILFLILRKEFSSLVFLSELLNSFLSVMGVFLGKCSFLLISFLAGRRRDVPRTCGERCHDEVSPYEPSSYIMSGIIHPLRRFVPWTFCPDHDYFLLRVSSMYTVLYRYSNFCF